MTSLISQWGVVDPTKMSGGSAYFCDFCFPGMTDPTKQRTCWDEHWEPLGPIDIRNNNRSATLNIISDKFSTWPYMTHIWPILELFWNYKKMTRFAQHISTHPVCRQQIPGWSPQTQSTKLPVETSEVVNSAVDLQETVDLYSLQLPSGKHTKTMENHHC
jgi:hypothetical protein